MSLSLQNAFSAAGECHNLSCVKALEEAAAAASSAAAAVDWL